MTEKKKCKKVVKKKAPSTSRKSTTDTRSTSPNSKPSSEPSRGTRKKPSTTLAKARAKMTAGGGFRTSTVPKGALSQLASKRRESSVRQALSTTERGRTSDTSSKGVLGRTRIRKRAAGSFPSGVVPGAFVLCTWPYESNFGSGEGVFTGTVKSIDDPPGWIKVYNPGAKTMLHWPAHYFTFKVLDDGD